MSKKKTSRKLWLLGLKSRASANRANPGVDDMKCTVIIASLLLAAVPAHAETVRWGAPTVNWRLPAGWGFMLFVGAGCLVWLHWAWCGLRWSIQNPDKLVLGFKNGVVWSVLGLVGLVIGAVCLVVGGGAAALFFAALANTVSSVSATMSDPRIAGPVYAALIVIWYLEYQRTNNN